MKEDIKKVSSNKVKRLLSHYIEYNKSIILKSVILFILCTMIAGCASFPYVEDNQTERQVIDIYDNQGKVKEHVIIKDGYITIYDKDWKTKGYGKVQK